jgi:hypothetical protein
MRGRIKNICYDSLREIECMSVEGFEIFDNIIWCDEQ